MNRFQLVPLVLVATVLHAGEPKIVETESGVIVEYSGSPSYPGSGENSPVNDENAMMVRAIALRIEQLKKETADISKLTGEETEAELAYKKALVTEKNRQIEVFAREVGQLEGGGQVKAPEIDQARVEQSQRQLNHRQEKKQRIMELKQLRLLPAAPVESP
jgi:iron only hydrogenase large subunit-like protein